MNPVIRIVSITITVELVTCTIAGLTYRDPYHLDPSYRKTLPGEDPCHPLYWYPRQIPEYCHVPKVPIPVPPQTPSPLPPPIPQPIQLSPPMPPPLPMPWPIPMPMPLPMPPPSQTLIPLPPYAPSYPFQAAIFQPNPMLPAPSFPYPSAPLIQAGLVPGIQGIVSHDGGINILPFSDAYSDLLEKHKQKYIRIRLQKLLDRYEKYPKRYLRRRGNGRIYDSV